MDLGANFKMARLFSDFAGRHPKLVPFITGLRSKGLEEQMEVAVAIRYPDGTEYKAGVRMTKEDIEMLRSLKDIKG